MAADLGQVIREARTRLGWGQDDLAARARVSRVQISRIETGARGVGLETLARVIKALEIDPGEALAAVIAALPGDDESGEVAA